MSTDHRPMTAQWCLRLAILLTAAVGASTSGVAQQARLYEVERLTGVVYGTGFVTSADGVPGTKALTLDIYRPKGLDRRDKMAMLVIHGGAFTGGRPGDLEGVARYFAEREFVCFSIAYRLAGDRGPDVRRAAYSDAKTAVRWIRAHAAEFGIDTGRIGAIGHSAGAVVALQIAIADVAAVASDGPVIAPANHPDQTSAIQAAAAVAGALTEPQHADATDPPLLFLHGTNDAIIPLERAQASMDRCVDAGLRARFLTAQGAGHDPWNERYDGSDLRPDVVAFFVEALSGAEGPLPESDGAILARGADHPLHLEITGDRDLEAQLAPIDPATTFHLEISDSAHGSVELDPPGGTYPAGTVVKLTPHPAPHYAFLAWAGDTRETLAPGYICMTGHRAVRAVFVPAPSAPRHTLDVGDSPGGRVVPAIPWSTFVEGDTVRVDARPEPGFRFVRWRHPLSGSDNPVTVPMDSSKTVVGEFERVLTVEPQVATLPKDGGDGVIAVAAARGAWAVAPCLERPWLRVEAADRAIGVSASVNSTSYARTGVLRVASDQEDVAPLLVLVQQPGQPLPEAEGPAMPRLAVYRGRPGEAGTLRWAPGSLGAVPHGLIEAHPDGGFAVGCYRGAALGYLTVDGEQPLQIPDGDDYHLHAAWDLPEDPEAIVDPETGVPVPAYLYIGMDSGGFDHTKLRFGIEWKDLGRGREWVLRVQRDSDDMAAAQANQGRTPSRIRLHVWKDSHGDTVVRPGGAAVRGQFSLDDGPWQDFVFSDKRTPGYYPIEGMGHDAGPDHITFKVRGLGTENLREIRVEGPNVPGVNSGAE